MCTKTKICSVTVWYTDNYAYYASIIIFMSVTSICADIYQIRKQELRLQSMVQSHETVMVLRNGGQVETIPQENVSLKKKLELEKCGSNVHT